MTKTEQNRVLAWRLKVLREASAAPGTFLRPAVISAYHAKRSISGRLDTKLRARQGCATGRAPRIDPHGPPRARSSPRFFICGSAITLDREGSQTICSGFTN
jgi:hypothetical protein